MQGPFLRKYGVETTVDFQLYETDGASFKTDAVHVAGDTNIMKDEGPEGQTDNGFTDEGQGYSIVLSATEMQAKRIVVYVVDQTSPAVWLDDSICVETYGNASAMHAFDLDTAIQDINVASIDNAAALDIADEVLIRGVSNVEASADVHSLSTVILGMTEWEITGGNWVIYRTNHSTIFVSKPLTTNAAADPIIEVD